MIIGVPREIKNNEYRVALTPSGVQVLVREGHRVIVETTAGAGSGFEDSEYAAMGAEIAAKAAQVYRGADLILKVKEPLPPEYELMREHQVIFTFLHLARENELTNVFLEKKITAIAYETIQLSDGRLPLLIPMSEVAGKMAIQIGAHFLEQSQGGRGVLLGGVPGVPPAEVVIIGAGTAGANAARVAIGMGAVVTLIDINIDRLRYFDEVYTGRVQTMVSNPYNISLSVAKADLLVGAVLLPGAKAPVLVSEEMVKKMKPGSVIIDVAIDQGGCVATIDRVSTHSNPIDNKHGVIHYSVGNIPGAVPFTSTNALTNATLPYLLEIAKFGPRIAAMKNPALAKGFNVCKGQVTHEGVASALSLPYQPVQDVLKLKL
ncbi:MAG: alanine dehydrogenase [Firmicutes bacterium HGW-Firmicutes-8]|nr:MAG: alanine dehydrogenase [Firmicutes bacterium HGW-Firmicutes-8]